MVRFVTYFDDLYYPLFEIMLNSFLKQNRWFDDYITIFDWGISGKNKSKVLEIYNKIEFLEVDKSKYDLKEETLDKIYFGKNFQKFEIFKLKYNKIVVLDADLLFLDDVRELFINYNNGFYVDYNTPSKLDPIVPYPDTGLMIIDKKYLTEKNYYKCLEKMKEELKKDTSKNSTVVSNEWVVDKIFKNQLKPIDEHLRISDINNISGKKILGAPEYKPFLKDNRYMNFVKKNLLPWNHKDEVRKYYEYIKLLKERELWNIMENL